MTDNKRYKLIAAGLLFIGSLQMIGDVLQIPAAKAIGMAWGISPAPKVFTAQHGYETYSTEFRIDWIDKDDLWWGRNITPSVYAQVKGPYNRRNVIGAALSYGPVLYTDPIGRPLFDDVTHYAVCGNAPLLREIGIDPTTIKPGTLKIRYIPALDSLMDARLPREIGVDCK